MTWKGKSRGGHLGYKIFIYVLKILGLKASYLLLRFVSFYYVLFVPKARKASYRYFRKIQGFGFCKSVRKVFTNFYIFGQTLIDKTAVLGGMGDRFTFNHDGLDYLNDLATQQTGAILISAHIGNYEMAGHLLDRLEVPVNIVMYDAEHQKIKDLLTEMYGDRKVNIIPIIENDFSHIIAIKSALDRKEVICLHGDRFVEGNQTIEVEFMGRKALFPYGPFLLINKFKVPYSMVFAVKESDTHYHFFASKPEVTTGNLDDVLKAYIVAVEEKLHAYPDQWFNFYDFWNLDESSN